MSIEIFCLHYTWYEVWKMEISFGEKIKNLREDKDMKQSELGAAINMTQRKISYIECGRFEPSLEDIVAFCKFFDVSADYLLGLAERKSTFLP